MNDDLAEQSVLSCCYQSPLALERAAAILTAGDFYNPRHETLWNVLRNLKSEGKPTDAMTVQVALQGHEVVTAAHLAVTLNGAIPESVEYHANKVRGDSRRRLLVAEARMLIQRAENTDNDAQLLTSEAANRFAAIRDAGAPAADSKTLGELMAQPDDPYDWVIPGLLERMDRLVLTGEEGLGKSVFLRQLALMGAAGIHPFTRDPMEPIRSHIIDLENTERHVKRQLRAMWLQAKIQGHDPSERVTINCRPGGIDICRDSDLSWVNSALDASKPDLLVIGPLYRMVPRALQTDDHVAPVIAALNSIRARGITLAMEAHAGHAKGKSDERDMRPRGSSALMGWPEFGYGLRWNEVGDADMVAWRGDRDERSWPPRIRRGGQWPWTAVDPSVSDEAWQRSLA